jgi:hypothetical protein
MLTNIVILFDFYFHFHGNHVFCDIPTQYAKMFLYWAIRATKEKITNFAKLYC